VRRASPPGLGKRLPLSIKGPVVKFCPILPSVSLINLAGPANVRLGHSSRTNVTFAGNSVATFSSAAGSVYWRNAPACVHCLSRGLSTHAVAGSFRVRMWMVMLTRWRHLGA